MRQKKMVNEDGPEDSLIRAGDLEVGASLSELSGLAISVLLDESEDIEIFRELLETNLDNPAVLKILREHPRTPPDVRQSASKQLDLPTPGETHLQALQTAYLEQRAAETPEAYETKRETLTMKLRKLTIGEKVVLSTKGNKEVRGILLKDSSKLVVLGVINSPKITDSEIEMAARSRNIMEEALRAISKKKEWMKNYNILLALITNPKTPPGISLHYAGFLKTKDLALLAKNKNIPHALTAGVNKFLTARREKSRDKED